MSSKSQTQNNTDIKKIEGNQMLPDSKAFIFHRPFAHQLKQQRIANLQWLFHLKHPSKWVLSNSCFYRAPILSFTQTTVWVSTLCLSLSLSCKLYIKHLCYHLHMSNISITKPGCKLTYIRFIIGVHNSFSLSSYCCQ